MLLQFPEHHRQKKNRQDILDKNEPIDLNKVLGVSFTPTRTKGIIDFMKINGADIDGNNIITPQEGSKFLSTLQKESPEFHQGTINRSI